ncbi:MAG: beta-propeller domain-containing protein [Deltaproteobacteria bacterium]|nr:beta-propeller domain-containing protein [Deltaproteobacteria bacterium]
MRHRSSLLVAFLAAGCAVGTARPPSPARVPASAPAASAPAAEAKTEPARPAKKGRASFPERRPELGIATAMSGEPSAEAAKESRLVAATCEKVVAEDAEKIIALMRKAVDASFKQWHDEQPACWEEMREEYRMRKEAEEAAAAGNLWGRGYGGGGSAQGIGLGSIGTIGHGAGSGTGSGYGAGAGRLSGSHKTEASAVRRSGTNNQVAGVDEADMVKTDGRFVYLASSGALRIVEAMNPRLLSTTKLPGTVRELFVEGDRAVVYTSLGGAPKRCTYGYDCAFGGDGTSTKVLVIDVANRQEPKVVRQIDLSGSLIAARRIGNAVHTVVADGDSLAPPYETFPAGLAMCGNDEKVVRARFAQLKEANEKRIRAKATTFPTLTDQGVSSPMCNGLLRTAIRDGGAFTSVVSFDMTNDTKPPSTATLQSRPGAVFASATALYVSVVHRKQASNGRWYSAYPTVDEISEIHKFAIGETAGSTRYVGSGTVPGHVLNQFAMDEWYGYLRVATTRGRVPDPKVASVMSILSEGRDGNLVRVGAVDQIAPGEDIRAVRFDGDRGYIVTFKKTDPLFVMDLYDPRRPQVLGELKIPGFSTYIHRIGPDHLLSIGFDANDHGNFAYFDGVILQLFDVKKPTEPKLLHKEKIGTRGSSSEAATDHLAFNWFADDGLLAVPMTICEGGGDGRNGDQLAFSGLLVYDVDVEKGFKRLGGVDHGTKGVSCGTWWSHATSAVKRSVFLDDLVYSVAPDRVKVQRVSELGHDLADLRLTD